MFVDDIYRAPGYVIAQEANGSSKYPLKVTYEGRKRGERFGLTKNGTIVLEDCSRALMKGPKEPPNKYGRTAERLYLGEDLVSTSKGTTWAHLKCEFHGLYIGNLTCGGQWVSPGPLEENSELFWSDSDSNCTECGEDIEIQIYDLASPDLGPNNAGKPSLLKELSS